MIEYYYFRYLYSNVSLLSPRAIVHKKNTKIVVLSIPGQPDRQVSQSEQFPASIKPSLDGVTGTGLVMFLEN